MSAPACWNLPQHGPHAACPGTPRIVSPASVRALRLGLATGVAQEGEHRGHAAMQLGLLGQAQLAEDGVEVLLVERDRRRYAVRLHHTHLLVRGHPPPTNAASVGRNGDVVRGIPTPGSIPRLVGSNANPKNRTTGASMMQQARSRSRWRSSLTKS